MALHKRKFVPGAVALTMLRLRHNSKALEEVHNEIEELIIKNEFLKDAPFEWIGLIYFYGEKNILIPSYKKISKKYGDLSVNIELNSDILEWADRNDLNLLKEIYMIGALEAVIHVGKKYKLPTELLEEERVKYGNIPESIEECEARKQTS